MKVSSVLALGLASVATADYNDWDPTTTTTKTTTTTTTKSSTTTGWGDWTEDPAWGTTSSTTTTKKTTTSSTTKATTTTGWGDWSYDPAWGTSSTTTTTTTPAKTTSSPYVWVNAEPATVYTTVTKAAIGTASTCPAGKTVTVTDNDVKTVTVTSTVGANGVWDPSTGVSAVGVSSWASSVAVVPVSTWVSTVTYAGGKSASTITYTSTATATATATGYVSWASGVSEGNKVPTGVDGHSWVATTISTVPSLGWSELPTATTAKPSKPTGSWNNTSPASGNFTNNKCNSPSNRGAWCDGFSISTDYYQSWPKTGKTCSYDFTITNTTINYDGDDHFALAINGQVPGPLIECNWGDNVVITVHNNMQHNGTAIHWHGIRQLGTNPQDGVPGVTECSIAPGQSRTYSWIATSYGSSWYHSHWSTQMGDGIKGPMIIHGPSSANYDYDAGSVMVDDIFLWTAAQTNSYISHNGPASPAFPKSDPKISVPSNYLLNGKNFKPDLSAGEPSIWTLEPNKTYLFRIVNSASQNMWSMHIDNHEFTVIATDFVPIVPYKTEWLNIGIGQRYDVLITTNKAVDSYFFRAVTQSACPSGNANTGLGNANGIIRYKGANSTLPTSTAGNVTPAKFATCNDEPIASLVPYVKKSAGDSSQFKSSTANLPVGPPGTVTTSDDGTVFVWTFNGGSINVNFDAPTLLDLADGKNGSISNYVTLGGSTSKWVYFVIQNQLPIGHPIHLHGHDFSLLGQGLGVFDSSFIPTLNFDNPPRRDTAILFGAVVGGATPGYNVIGFETDNPGAWLMHCHIAWHVDGGLALQFVERPSDIPAKQWTSSSEFQNECSSYKAYENNGGAIHSAGESGLKRRVAEDAGVVRRSEKSEKRYLENYLHRSARHNARL